MERRRANRMERAKKTTLYSCTKPLAAIFEKAAYNYPSAQCLLKAFSAPFKELTL